MSRKLGSIGRKLFLIAIMAVFACTYVYLGNPIIDEIADYGSAGVNSLDPCQNPSSGIFC